MFRFLSKSCSLFLPLCHSTLIISPSCYNYFFDLASCLCMYIVLGISSLPSSNRRTPLPIEKHAPAYWNPFNSITHRHNLKRISIRGEGRPGQGRAGGSRGGQLSSWWPAAPVQCPPFLPSYPSYVSLTIIAYFLTWNLGGAASDCARVLVYDTAKRRMQHVFTVLFSVCPMPELQLRLRLHLRPLPLPALSRSPRFTCSNCHWSV